MNDRSPNTIPEPELNSPIVQAQFSYLRPIELENYLPRPPFARPTHIDNFGEFWGPWGPSKLKFKNTHVQAGLLGLAIGINF